MDNQRRETAELKVTPVSEAEQDRLRDLAHKVTVEIVKAIAESQLKEPDSHIHLALSVIDSKDEDGVPYILKIVNEGLRQAREQLSKPWTTDELVPVKPQPRWDPQGLLNNTMTYQQKNAKISPTPRLLYDSLMTHRESPITLLAEAALRPKPSLQAKIDILLGKPRPSKEKVMTEIVDAYAYDMAIYFRREMEKPETTSPDATPEELATAKTTLKSLFQR